MGAWAANYQGDFERPKYGCPLHYVLSSSKLYTLSSFSPNTQAIQSAGAILLQREIPEEVNVKVAQVI